MAQVSLSLSAPFWVRVCLWAARALGVVIGPSRLGRDRADCPQIPHAPARVTWLLFYLLAICQTLMGNKFRVFVCLFVLNLFVSL